MQRDNDGCRCADGLHNVLCQRVYTIGHRGARKTPVGRVVICVDSTDIEAADPRKYGMSLILYGSCDDPDVNRLIGYDTAHDAYHQQMYGDCHRHNCQNTIPQTPCDYSTVLLIFRSEVNHEIASRGYHR